MAKTIYRYKAGQSGSSQPVEVLTEKHGETKEKQIVYKEKKNNNTLLVGANYFLGILPFTKRAYRNWTKMQRISVGYLLWLIVLPLLPVAILLLMWVHDPRGFRKKPALPLLLAIAILWLWIGYGFLQGLR